MELHEALQVKREMLVKRRRSYY